MPGHVVPTSTCNKPTIMIVHRWTATTLRRGVVLSCAPRSARWPIATHHPVVPSVHSASVSPAPYPLATPVHPRVTDTVAAVYTYNTHTQGTAITITSPLPTTSTVTVDCGVASPCGVRHAHSGTGCCVCVWLPDSAWVILLITHPCHAMCHII